MNKQKMSRKSDLDKALKPIIRFFMTIGPKVYRRSDLENILANQRNEWHLRDETSLGRFIRFATEALPLKQIQLSFPNRPEVRYMYGVCSIYEVTQSLKTEGYFSHRTAAEIHGFLVPSYQIFFNFEQSMRSQSSGEMTQESINRAFYNIARISQNKAKYDEYVIWLLNGKNTDCYGVIQYNKSLRVTNIPRTLIDIVVRPGYCGGPLQILQAYRKGLETVDGLTIAQTLAKLKHTYPYHQVVGYYMEKAGFGAEHLEPLKKMPIKFDFYLDYQIVEPLYSSAWRLYYPALLDKY
jgi:hypothetical protein